MGDKTSDDLTKKFNDGFYQKSCGTCRYAKSEDNGASGNYMCTNAIAAIVWGEGTPTNPTAKIRLRDRACWLHRCPDSEKNSE